MLFRILFYITYLLQLLVTTHVLSAYKVLIGSLVVTCINHLIVKDKIDALIVIYFTNIINIILVIILFINHNNHNVLFAYGVVNEIGRAHV